MRILSTAGAMTILMAVCAYAQAGEMALTALVELLRQQGHTILYSNSLVYPGQRVSVDAVTVPALAQALPELDLQLQRIQGVWVITQRVENVPAVEPTEPVVTQPKLLETVIVTGTLHRFPPKDLAASSHSFSAQDMARIPSLGSDAMRAALRLPGVSSVGVSAKPQIRGGLQDELLVIQDGVELLEPFHLADYHSAYSTLDYHTIESVDIYTGGFPSRYGNRMSGVIDIRNDWQEDEYDTDIGLSSFANFVHTRGQLGQRSQANWLLSLRTGDLSGLTDYIESRSGKPKYLDGAARMQFQLSDQLGLAGGAVYAKDDIVFKDEEERASSQIDTTYVWSGLDWQPSQTLRSQLTVSWLDFHREKLQGSFEDEDKGGVLDHRQDIQRLAVRNDFSSMTKGAFLEFGWQAEYNRAHYRHISRIDRGELAEIIATERLVERDIDLRPDGWSGGAYLQGEWELNARWLIQPSVRWDFQDYYLERGAQYQLSPRLGMAYEFSESSRIRLSLGRFHQPEGIQELQVLDGITRFFTPQSSDQVVAGWEWRYGDREFVGELYYKRYDNLKGRYENMFNPFVLLPEMEPDRVGLYPDKAVASGLDLDFKYHFSPPLTGQLRYSYMEADDHIEGRWIPRRWSQQHTVNAGLLWQNGSFSCAIAVTWHSGWRSSRLPPAVAEDVVIPATSVLNNTELPHYYSLDISARKSWEIGRFLLQIHADISNLTDRDNVAGIDYDPEEVDGGYLLIPDQETLLKRVPSVGITLSF